MTMAADAIMLRTLADHSLWIHTETGKQPKRCSCGHGFIPGEHLNAHIVQALQADLCSAGFCVGPVQQ